MRSPVEGFEQAFLENLRACWGLDVVLHFRLSESGCGGLHLLATKSTGGSESIEIDGRARETFAIAQNVTGDEAASNISTEEYSQLCRDLYMWTIGSLVPGYLHNTMIVWSAPHNWDAVLARDLVRHTYGIGAMVGDGGLWVAQTEDPNSLLVDASDGICVEVSLPTAPVLASDGRKTLGGVPIDAGPAILASEERAWQKYEERILVPYLAPLLRLIDSASGKEDHSVKLASNGPILIAVADETDLECAVEKAGVKDRSILDAFSCHSIEILDGRRSFGTIPCARGQRGRIDTRIPLMFLYELINGRHRREVAGNVGIDAVSQMPYMAEREQILAVIQAQPFAWEHWTDEPLETLLSWE